MTDRDIRAWLRGATKAKVLVGWYWHGPDHARRYTVNAPGGITTFGSEAAAGYCDMLRAAGVEPLYRA